MSKMHSLLKNYKPFFNYYGYSFRNSFFYKNYNNIVFCFEFSNASHVYCDCYLVPLYIPSSYRYFTYGNRLEIITNYKILPLHPNNCFEKWMSDVTTAISTEIIPFFDSISSPDKILSCINEDNTSFDHYIACSIYDKMILRMYTNLYLGKISDAKKDVVELKKQLTQERNGKWKDLKIERIINIESNVLSLSKEDISAVMQDTIIRTEEACGFRCKKRRNK